MSTAPLARGRLLLVTHDMAVIRTLTESGLTPDGVETTTVHSVQEAILEVTRRPYDIILVDTRLPDLSGRDLIAAVQTLSRTLPLVLIARKGEERDIVQARRLGASDFILWPAGEAEVAQVVRRNLDRQRLRLAYQESLAQVRRLRKEGRRIERQLAGLQQLARLVSDTPRRAMLLPQFMQALVGLVQAQRAWLTLRVGDKRAPALRLVSYYNLPPGWVKNASNSPWKDGLSELVLLSGEALLIQRPALEKFPVRTLGQVALLVPLRWGGATFGVLGLMRTTAHNFSTLEQRLAEIAAALLMGHLRPNTRAQAAAPRQATGNAPDSPTSPQTAE